MTQPRHDLALLDHLPLVPGPGAMGRGGAPACVLFAAGSGAATQDLFADFWVEEAPGLDWLRHFLCDPATDAMVERLSRPEEDDDGEEEILYSRSQLTTLGSEVMDGP